MENENNNQGQQIQIEVPAEEMQGKYANLAMILMAPNMPKARVQSRIIMTPENAKQLLSALAQNVQKYEQTFGEIEPRMPRGAQPGPDGIIDFPLPKGQA